MKRIMVLAALVAISAPALAFSPEDNAQVELHFARPTPQRQYQFVKALCNERHAAIRFDVKARNLVVEAMDGTQWPFPADGAEAMPGGGFHVVAHDQTVTMDAYFSFRVPTLVMSKFRDGHPPATMYCDAAVGVYPR